MSTASSRDEIREAVGERIAAQRENHRRRPLVLRILAGAAGFLLTLAGLVLLWAPEFGLPLLVAGFGMLALEFDWAVRARAWAEWRFLLLRAWVKRQPPLVKVAFPLLLLAVVGVVVWRMAG